MSINSKSTQISNSIFFSVIIPIYNAKLFLRKTIESVVYQTFKSWELILVDDFSTDNSYQIACEYAEKYSNIYAFQLPKNSGSAKLPIDYGVNRSNGMFCLHVGNDDILESVYLEIIYNRYEQTKADILLPVMTMIDYHTENILSTLPDSYIDTSDVTSGKEACKATLINWHIGCNGMAYRRSLYDYVTQIVSSNFTYSDEFAEHVLLYFAKKVAFTNAEYKYIIHNESITHKPSIKLYQLLYYNNEILKFFSPKYSDDKNFVKELWKKKMSLLIIKRKQYLKTKKLYSNEEHIQINKIFKENFYSSEKDAMKSAVGKWKYFLLGQNYILFKLICYLLTLKDKIKHI